MTSSLRTGDTAKPRDLDAEDAAVRRPAGLRRLPGADPLLGGLRLIDARECGLSQIDGPATLAVGALHREDGRVAPRVGVEEVHQPALEAGGETRVDGSPEPRGGRMLER